MAITIPIISEFNGKGIQKAIKSFKQLETNGQKAMFVLKNGAKAVAAGLLAVGAAAAAAAAVGFQFVQAAMEDEKSQRMLAQALKASTKASAADIATREKWIDTTSRALGIADDKLRPAYARLVRSTKDADKAQRLLNLALNISAATGKPLETVVMALGRAYDGNNTALGRLGLGLDKATLKGKTFAQVQDTLENNFSGAAARAADTYEGRLARLKVAFNELKESLGRPLLAAADKVAKAILRISDAFGSKGLTGAVQQAKLELNTLLYDQSGALNSFGQTLNKIIHLMNAIEKSPSLLRRALQMQNFTVSPIAAPKTGGGPAGITALPENIGANAIYGNIRNLVPTGRGSGTTNYNFNINAPTGDAAAIGRSIRGVLNQFDRRTGGK